MLIVYWSTDYTIWPTDSFFLHRKIHSKSNLDSFNRLRGAIITFCVYKFTTGLVDLKMDGTIWKHWIPRKIFEKCCKNNKNRNMACRMVRITKFYRIFKSTTSVSRSRKQGTVGASPFVNYGLGNTIESIWLSVIVFFS